jgi:hypothetical protein
MLRVIAEREAELLPVPYFSRGVQPAGPDRRYRLPEQGRDLRPVVQSVIADDADHRR